VHQNHQHGVRSHQFEELRKESLCGVDELREHCQKKEDGFGIEKLQGRGFQKTVTRARGADVLQGAETIRTPALETQVQQVSGASVFEHGKGRRRSAEDQADTGCTDGGNHEGSRGNPQNPRHRTGPAQAYGVGQGQHHTRAGTQNGQGGEEYKESVAVHVWLRRGAGLGVRAD